MNSIDSSDGHMGIGEVARRFGLDPDTIRYYERHGVLPQPPRDAAGRRSYDDDAVHLIAVLLHLKETGMPLARIAAFTAYVASDPAGVPERLALLQQHRESVQQRIRTWTESLHVIDQKIADYQARVNDSAP